MPSQEWKVRAATSAWNLHRNRLDLSMFQPFSVAAEPQQRCRYATFHGEYALTFPVTMNSSTGGCMNKLD